jgi:hypothetical protein
VIIAADATLEIAKTKATKTINFFIALFLLNERNECAFD